MQERQSAYQDISSEQEYEAGVPLSRPNKLDLFTVHSEMQSLI